MYAYRIKKYIGSYAAVLNGLDALVFTAGVGKNDAGMRQMVCTEMDFSGHPAGPGAKRRPFRELREVNTPDSRVKVLVIPTDEELEIARQCYGLLEEERETGDVRLETGDQVLKYNQ